jgi:hypothetical protein
MALTTEQQASVDMAIAIEAARAEGQATAQAIADAKRTKLEALRLAKEVLIENARYKSVDSRDVSASDITTFATTLNTYINS